LETKIINSKTENQKEKLRTNYNKNKAVLHAFTQNLLNDRATGKILFELD